MKGKADVRRFLAFFLSFVLLMTGSGMAVFAGQGDEGDQIKPFEITGTEIPVKGNLEGARANGEITAISLEDLEDTQRWLILAGALSASYEVQADTVDIEKPVEDARIRDQISAIENDKGFTAQPGQNDPDKYDVEYIDLAMTVTTVSGDSAAMYDIGSMEGTTPIKKLGDKIMITYPMPERFINKGKNADDSFRIAYVKKNETTQEDEVSYLSQLSRTDFENGLRGFYVWQGSTDDKLYISMNIDRMSVYAVMEDARTPFSLKGVTWDYDGPYYYNGKEYEVKINEESLKNALSVSENDTQSVSDNDVFIIDPDEIEIIYSGNKATETGNYTARAQFKYDKTRYVLEGDDIISLEWEIAKKSSIVDALWEMVKEYQLPFSYEDIVSAADSIDWSEIMNKISISGNDVDAAGQYLSDMWSEILSKVSVSGNSAEKAGEYISGAWKDIRDSISVSGNCAEKAGDYISGAWKDIRDSVSVSGNCVDKAGKLISNTWEEIRDLWNSATETYINDETYKKLDEDAKAIVDFFSKIDWKIPGKNSDKNSDKNGQGGSGSGSNNQNGSGGSGNSGSGSQGSGKGTAAGTVSGTGSSVKAATTTVSKTTAAVTKTANTMTVQAKAAKVKYTKIKNKNKKINVTKVLDIGKAQGKVSYKLKSVPKKAKKKIKFNAKTGKITLKKKLKKGTYKLKFDVTAAGSDKYDPVTKTVTVKIKVK